VLRRPVVSATLAVTKLVTLAIPTLQIHTASSGLRTLPRSAPTVETIDRVQAAFPGQPSPAVIDHQDEHHLAGQQDRGR
jgi:uncharacterized membrane protein YdfJ with MMPL/SSD domain